MDVMTDSYIYVITALLPVVAVMLIVQVNPYHALVLRGILGAVAALLYTILGAADVALTEALVGTLLAIMLYAVAVRSSMVLRLGILRSDEVKSDSDRDAKATSAVTVLTEPTALAALIRELRGIFAKRHMRVDVLPFGDRETLHHALAAQDIHATCTPILNSVGESENSVGESEMVTHPGSNPGQTTYHTITRLQRLYDIIQTELTSPLTQLSYIDAADLSTKLSNSGSSPSPKPPPISTEKRA